LSSIIAAAPAALDCTYHDNHSLAVLLSLWEQFAVSTECNCSEH